jgi:Ca2+-binding RTX toxin-like protein
MFKDGRSSLPYPFSKRARLVSRALIAAAALAAVALAAPGGASADTGASWHCRGSVEALFTPIPIAGLDRIEPVVANGQTDPSTGFPVAGDPGATCANTDAGSPAFAFPPGSSSNVSGRNLFASTRVSDPNAPTNTQAVSASAGVTDGSGKSPDGSFTMHVGYAHSFAAAACSGGQPQYTGGSQVDDVVMNGQKVPVDDTQNQVAQGITDGSGGQISVKFNEEIKTASSIIRRAVHVKMGSGALAFEWIMGESKVSNAGDVCAGQTQTTPGSCPTGTTKDEASGFCVSTVEVSRGRNGECPNGSVDQNGTCFVVFPVVGAGETPVGGTLVPISQLKGGDARCKKPGFGRDFAIVGTNGPDRITGTNHADRIFSFGGNDRVDGGRAADCIDGGKGKDQLDGGAGSDLVIGGSARDILNGGTKNDRLYGGSGHDVLNGGSGNDRMWGESGRDKLAGGTGNDTIWGGSERDYIQPGPGRDRVFGQSGPDFINVANGGPAATVDCGSGRDKVRFNRNERHKLKGCERQYMIK